MSGHGVFYLRALYNELEFKLTLAPASQVVKCFDTTKLKYKLAKIELEYEIIHSETLTEEVHSVYPAGRELAYDHVGRLRKDL